MADSRYLRTLELAFLAVVAVGLVSGCLPSARTTIATDDVSRAAFVELLVRNPTTTAVRITVNWHAEGEVGGTPKGKRGGLSELPGGGTGTFSIHHTWRRISLSAVAVTGTTTGASPPGVSIADGTPVVTTPGRPLLPRGTVVELEPSQRLEWTVVPIGASFVVYLDQESLRAGGEADPPS